MFPPFGRGEDDQALRRGARRERRRDDRARKRGLPGKREALHLGRERRRIGERGELLVVAERRPRRVLLRFCPRRCSEGEEDDRRRDQR
jgi:hypothetical protein